MKLRNTLTAILGATLVSASAFAATPDKEYRFVGDTQFSSFCKAIVMDDVKVMRTSLARGVGRIGASQRDVLRLVTAEDGLTCNGSSLIEFSLQRNAASVHRYLTSRN